MFILVENAGNHEATDIRLHNSSNCQIELLDNRFIGKGFCECPKLQFGILSPFLWKLGSCAQNL